MPLTFGKKKSLPAKVKSKAPKERTPSPPPTPTDTMPVRTMAEEVSHKVALLMDQAGTIKLTEKQKKILYAPVKEKDIEIRPDGIVYLPWSFYAKTLRNAFGNQWAQMPADIPKIEGNLILQPFWLFIYGKPQASAWGQQEYKESNPQMTYGDALEGCASNGLMRLCKKIGISSELWDKNFVEQWKEKYAEKWFNPKAYNKKTGKYGKNEWRKKGDKKVKGLLENEQEIKEESQPEKTESPNDKEKVQDGKNTKESAEEMVGKIRKKAEKNKEEYVKMATWCDKNSVKYSDKQLHFFTDLYKSHTVADSEHKWITDLAKKENISEAIDKLKVFVYNRRDVEQWIQKQTQRKDIKLSAEILQHITKNEKTSYDLQREVVMAIEGNDGKDSKIINTMLKKHLKI